MFIGFKSSLHISNVSFLNYTSDAENIWGKLQIQKHRPLYLCSYSTGHQTIIILLWMF